MWLQREIKHIISSFKGAAGKHQLVMEFDFGTADICGYFEGLI